MTIGITGGIGGGKTTVSRVVQAMGYPVYNADRRAAQLQNQDSEIRRQTLALLGTEAYNGNVANRSYISAMVFRNPALLQSLNNIVHPAVKANFEMWERFHGDNRLLFIESALLYETEFWRLADKIIVVTANLETRVERVMQRDNISKQQVLERIKNQLPDDAKIARADFVIYNENEINLHQEIKNIIFAEILNRK
jgi:dephospho-CoA kinase